MAGPAGYCSSWQGVGNNTALPAAGWSVLASSESSRSASESIRVTGSQSQASWVWSAGGGSLALHGPQAGAGLCALGTRGSYRFIISIVAHWSRAGSARRMDGGNCGLRRWNVRRRRLCCQYNPLNQIRSLMQTLMSSNAFITTSGLILQKCIFIPSLTLINIFYWYTSLWYGYVINAY